MQLTTETTIREIRVMTTQLRPMRSFSLMPKLLRIAGPALAPLMNGDVNLQSDIDLLFPSFVKAIERLDESDSEDLTRRVLERTIAIRDGKKYELTSDAQIDQAFEGDFRALIETLWFVLKANYESFFAADLKEQAESSLAKAQAAKAKS